MEHLHRNIQDVKPAATVLSYSASNRTDMYGIVNRAIGELIVDRFGTDRWERVKDRAGLTLDFFISNEPYEDAVTYRLVEAAVAETGMPAAELLVAFGEWWVLHTGKKRYGALMEAGGTNLKSFLINLPQFHNRVMLLYPSLVPPEFQITDIGATDLQVHYFSERQGLLEFVRGLLQGIGKLYDTPVTVQVLQSRDSGASHEIFHVSWSA